MGETKNQIENHIEDAREDLGSNLQELERKVKSVTDWKHYYAKSPMTMIGVAFGAGCSVGGDGGRNKHNRLPAAFRIRGNPNRTTCIRARAPEKQGHGNLGEHQRRSGGRSLDARQGLRRRHRPRLP